MLIYIPQRENPFIFYVNLYRTECTDQIGESGALSGLCPLCSTPEISIYYTLAFALFIGELLNINADEYSVTNYPAHGASSCTL
jgi:hypothetical protein